MSVASPEPLAPSEVVLGEEKHRNIQKWVLQTQFHPPADPFIPATPPITLCSTPNSPALSITTYTPLSPNMANTPCPGPMIPPLMFNPNTGHNRHPVTTGYVSPNMSMNMVPSPALFASAPATTAAPVPILPSTAPRPPQVQPVIPNPFSGVGNVTTMPAQALSQRAPVEQVPSQAYAQPGPAFIPPYSGSRHRRLSGDRHHRHHHHHLHHHSRHSSRSHDPGHGRERTGSYSPVRRGHQDHARRARVVNDDKAEEDDDINPPIPPDYVPASPGPEHKSHLGARARAGIAGIGHRAAGAVEHGERHGVGGKDRSREEDRKHGHGYGHERGRVHSHDYAKDLVSALHHLSVGGGGGNGSGGNGGGGGTVGGGGQIHSSSPRPTFTRHRSRSIDDRDLQTSKARYANTGGVGAGGYQYQYQQQQQPVSYQQQPLPYQTQQGATTLTPVQQQQPQQPGFLQQSSSPYQTQHGAIATGPAMGGGGGGQPTMIYPSASPTQPTFVPTHNPTGRSGGGGQWMFLAPTSVPAASTSRPRAASTGARAPSSPSFCARFFRGFGRRHGHGQVNGAASTRAVQPLPPPPLAHSPVQYVHHYMPHSHHHHQRRGHDDRKLAKRRRKSF